MVSSNKKSWRTMVAALCLATAALAVLLLSLQLEVQETTAQAVSDGDALRLPEGAPAFVGLRVAAPGVRFSRARAGEQEPGAAGETDVVETTAAEVIRLRVQGRVVNANDGAALFGVPLGRGGEASYEILGWSGRDGSFELELSPADTLVETHGSSWATVVAAPLSPGAEPRELLLLAAPAMDLAGFVVRADGTGVAAAAVRLSLPPALVAGLPEAADLGGMREYATMCSQRGYFELLSLPAVRAATVEVTGEDFAPTSFELPALSSYDVTWVIDELAPPVALEEGPLLSGTVVLADGELAGEARVRLGALETTCDWRGEFELPVDRLDPGSHLIAWLPGLQPACVPEFDGVLAKINLRSDPVLLTLGGPLRSLRGRVVRADGSPCASWVVSLLDATGLYPPFDPPTLLEELVGAGELPEATTDPEGHFELGGVLARTYRLRAWDPETLTVVHSDAVAVGGEDARVEVPADALVERLVARVQSLGGRPLPGAELRLRIARSSGAAGPLYRYGASAIADGDGRVELANVPRRHGEVVVSGDTFDAQVRALVVAEGEELVLDVAERSQFRVQTEGRPAERIALLGADGSPCPVAFTRGGERVTELRPQLAEGRSEVLTIAEGSYTLVLYDAGETELERRPLELSPDALQVVHY